MGSMFAAILTVAAAVLAPAKAWFPPNAPINVNVKAEGKTTLVLTDFAGRRLEAAGAEAQVSGEKTVDLRPLYNQLATPGTYVLFAAKGDAVGAAAPTVFAGTPLVVEVRENRKRGAPPGPMVVKVEPLRYATMQTEKGPLTMVFYYDVAPNTVTSFLTLAREGYFDGLTFHRIVPDFVIQGGDPKGDGTGGPGFSIGAEFNDRPHVAGTLSMARTGDPSEGPGGMPRSEFANSAGSQFFICLNYENTRALDKKYTVFGRVIEGMDAVKAIATTPIADPATGQPTTPQVIQKVEVKDVTAAANPYATMFKEGTIEALPATPAAQPAGK